MNSLTHEQAHSRKYNLTAAGILDGLLPDQIKDLESMGVYMEYHRELVVADSCEIQYFFYIIKGNFEVSKVNLETQKKCILATIGEGESFGEMSFLTGSMASANVMANEDVIAWAIPHPSLRQFMETHPGGVRLGLNIATLLARRIQEGNTRLMGMNSTLSAYFGATARTPHHQVLEAPQASEHAEMEIPDDVFDGFVRETCHLNPDAPITEAQREQVEAKVETNEVDIVPWLEMGGSKKKMKVRLKFVEEQSPRIAVDSSSPSATLGVSPRIVRVPQVRARIAPAIAYVKEPPTLQSRLTSILISLGISLLTLLLVFKFLPFESRETLSQSSGYQSLPFQAIWNWIVFSKSSHSENISIKHGAEYALPLRIPSTTLVSSRLILPQKNSQPLHLSIRLKGADLPEHTLEIEAGAESVELHSARLKAGNYVLEITCKNIPYQTQIKSILEVTTLN